MNKMKLANNAVVMLDKAESVLDYNSTDAIHVLLCRAGVYSSLPKTYNKLDAAISDLETLNYSLDKNTFSEVKTDALILLSDNYIKKRMFKTALDKYHEALKIRQKEYYSKLIKEKIANNEALYLENIKNNF